MQNIDNQDITDILDREITEDEILSAVKNLCNGKALCIKVIKLLYKNKGDQNNLDNYCAICLTSNLGKVFTSILNSRLNNLLDGIG